MLAVREVDHVLSPARCRAMYCTPFRTLDLSTYRLLLPFGTACLLAFVALFCLPDIRSIFIKVE